jgi:sugar (pentulose or hexulose) kinase
MSPTFVIGIDSSTTACKAIAWDAHGTALAEGRATYPLLEPQPTWYEQDACDWWRGTCAALKDLSSRIDLSRAEALCITHQRESFVVVDTTGLPLRNAILWLDERSRRQVDYLINTFGRDHIHQVTGKPPSMNPALPKIVWLIQNEPDVIRRTAKILDVHAYLIYRLTGQFRTSLACADPQGLVDMRAQTWAVDLIRGLNLRLDQFSELVQPGAPIGLVSSCAAAECGLPAGLPIFAGAGDGQCAGLGTNAAIPERAYLNLGTAVVSGVISPQYLANPAFRTLYAPIPGNFYLESVIRGGVFMISWFADKFASEMRAGSLSPEDFFGSAAAQVPPGSQGLMLVPYWNNVMNPYWDAAASGIMVGWTGAHGREHFYRAILEGIAYEQRLASEGVMNALGRPINEFVALGGGSRSPLWCQILADVTHLPVQRSGSTEATCLGAGILAAAGVGWYPDILTAANAMTHTAQRFEPQPENQAIYDRLFKEVYLHLFPTLQPLVDRLTDISQQDA